MKKTVICIFVLFLAVMVQAQDFTSKIDVRGIKVDSLLMEKKGSKINLDMFVNLTELDVHTTEVAVLTPWIIKENDSLKLQSVGFSSGLRL